MSESVPESVKIREISEPFSDAVAEPDLALTLTAVRCSPRRETETTVAPRIEFARTEDRAGKTPRGAGESSASRSRATNARTAPLLVATVGE